MSPKSYVAAVVGFILLVIPMMILDLLVSPFATWNRLSLSLRRQDTIREIKNLVVQIEGDLHKRRVERSEIN